MSLTAEYAKAIIVTANKLIPEYQKAIKTQRYLKRKWEKILEKQMK